MFLQSCSAKAGSLGFSSGGSLLICLMTKALRLQTSPKAQTIPGQGQLIIFFFQCHDSNCSPLQLRKQNCKNGTKFKNYRKRKWPLKSHKHLLPFQETCLWHAAMPRCLLPILAMSCPWICGGEVPACSRPGLATSSRGLISSHL